MSTSYITADLRKAVLQRAGGLCEYCLISQADSYFRFEIDHVISEKHGGPTVLENLALSCVMCNKAKGSDIGSILWETGELVRYFHPRRDHWSDHFQLLDSRIHGLTPIGKVTARLLGFNDDQRVQEREILQKLGAFPGKEASKRLQVKS